jgi:hypothetical protein
LRNSWEDELDILEPNWDEISDRERREESDSIGRETAMISPEDVDRTPSAQEESKIGEELTKVEVEAT